MASRPKGDRILCEVKIGKTKFYAHVKEGTQKLLGLTKVEGKLPNAKKARAKGWKGTQSYTLLLSSVKTIGKHQNCVSVDLPVSPHCHLQDVYAWAYKQASLAGIITPWGIKYAWKSAAKRPGKNLLQKGLDTASGLLHDVTDPISGLADDVADAAGNVGDFIQGAEDAAGTIGDYIKTAEQIADLGKYLL